MNEIVKSLLIAVSTGRTDIVRSVIATCQSGEINETDEFNPNSLLNTPLNEDGTILHIASKENQADIVRALLVAGADPCIQNQEQKTPLDVTTSSKVQLVFNDQLLQCIAQSNLGHICQLLAAGVNVNLRDSPTYNNTPLHWAACYGNQEVVECLCSRGALVNAVNSCGATPLHDAVLRGEASVVQELLQSGAYIHQKAFSGKYKEKSPVELAQHNPELLQLFNMSDGQLANGINSLTLQNGASDAQETEDTVSMTPVVPSDLNVASTNHSVLPADGKSVPNTPTTPQPSHNAMPETTKAHEDEFSTLKSKVNNIKNDPLMSLWPRPQKLIRKEGIHFTVPSGTLLIFLNYRCQPELVNKVVNVWKTYEEAFEVVGIKFHLETMMSDQTFVTPHVISEVNSKLFSRRESYRLNVSHRQIKLQASDLSGLHCALCTLLQLFKFCKGGIQNLQIDDYPDIRDRGVVVDMSKGRMPVLDYMKHYIVTLSQLKINQIYVYHRFSIPNDPTVKWQFPYTRSTLMELSQFCVLCNIELIPVLDLTPNVTIEDLDILYPSFQAFLGCFLSTSIIGIGPRLSSFLIDITDEGDLNLEDTERFLPVESHQTLQLCAFVFHDVPHILSQFPCNMTLAEYGFQACYNFEKYSRMYEENGIPFYSVPGTAAWNSLAGCPEAAVHNIYRGVQSVIAHGGLGVLVSHWSGVSHMTHHPMMWPGIVTGAGLAWNSSIEEEYLHGNLAELMNRHILQDQSEIGGQVIIELGRAETYLLRCARKQAGSDHSNLPAEKGTTIFQLLTHPDELDLENLSVDMFQKTMRHIRKCQSELSKANLQCYDGSITVSELQVTADLMLTACKVGRQLVNVGKKPDSSAGCDVVNLGVSNLLPTTKTDMANRLLSQIENYRTIWLSRNLPQGLQDSLLIMSNMLKQLMPDDSTSHEG